MPTPKKKTSRSRRDMRRSHDALSTPAMGFDKKMGEFHTSHHAYKSSDGAFYYRGKEIIPAKTKKQAEDTDSASE